jgi:hypothetical protein
MRVVPDKLNVLPVNCLNWVSSKLGLAKNGISLYLFISLIYVTQ